MRNESNVVGFARCTINRAAKVLGLGRNTLSKKIKAQKV